MKSRLDKVLSSSGMGSRRDVRRILRERQVTVNGARVVDPGALVDPEFDGIALEGKPLSLKQTVYLMLNKPSGVVTSTEDPLHRTVMDLFEEPWSRMNLFPIGRLDRDTEGLLVITNDGPLGHRLTSPKTGVDKTYLAILRDPVSDARFAEYAARFREGVSFPDGYVTLPASLARAGSDAGADANASGPARSIGDGSFASVLLTIQEGKFHQVKRMFKAVGNEVIYLKRVSMGSLALDPALAPGAYRELTESEIAGLSGEGIEG
ncbi:MAG TPA: pseudouridine synthase [Treponemataceae bacterium]|nr:pseudouridine synthase [Treponemataceae bacterium]